MRSRSLAAAAMTTRSVIRGPGVIRSGSTTTSSTTSWGGASMDSLFPNHPGLPRNHALFEHNLIHSNNSNYYAQVWDGTCALPYQLRGIEKGVVCPAVPVPVGSGILVIGGDYDIFRENWVYDNWRVGFVQLGVPGLVRGDNTWPAQEETSNFNSYIGNHMGSDPRGENLPNGLDFFWDGQGVGSCWQDAHPSGTEPIAVPACPAGGQQRLIADPNKLVLFIDCTGYKLAAKTLPVGCDWFDTPARPGVFVASITILSIAPAAQFIAVLVVFAMLVRHRGRPGLLAISASFAAGFGSILLLLASTEQFWHLAAPGIGILGIGWLGAVRLVPTRRLAVFTLILGIVALFEAVDIGIVT